MNSTPPTIVDGNLQLTDMVRILDVAAEMRLDREMASREFAVDETKKLLRERLLASSRLTGDTATPEEIDAAIEHYYQSLYTFKEPRWSFSVAVAHLYVRRLRIAISLVVLSALAIGGRLLFSPSSGYLSTTAQQAKKWQADLKELEALGSSVRMMAHDPSSAKLIDEQIVRLQTAAQRRDSIAMNSIRQQLLRWQQTLEEEYEVRIVSDPKRKSGIDRYYNDENGKRVSGYYLIVEARTPDGRVLPREIFNSETGRRETVTSWGESVPDEVWERIKSDKKTDGILDETLFAAKKRGQLISQIVMQGVAAGSVRRQITSW